jgi:hypothetical protein
MASSSDIEKQQSLLKMMVRFPFVYSDMILNILKGYAPMLADADTNRGCEDCENMGDIIRR